jgi:hypothetical protein
VDFLQNVYVYIYESVWMSVCEREIACVRMRERDRQTNR